MSNEIGIGIAYDGDQIGVVIIVNDEENGESISLTLSPDRAAYLGQRLGDISDAIPELENRIRGLPFEYAEALIYDWARDARMDSD